MRILDPFAHLSWRSSADHQSLARAGVRAVVEPCTWPGRPRTQVGSFQDHFGSLSGFERSRAGQFGLRYFAALALNPREANDARLSLPVLNLLPHFLAGESILAVGETGYDRMTEAEDAAFEWQLDLARRFELPVLVRVPAADRARAVRRALAVIRRSGLPEGLIAVGPNDEETLPSVLASGCWASHTLCLRARFDVSRMAALCLRHGTERLLVGSGADWDLSDPLALPSLAELLRQSGLAGATIETILWSNPVSFFRQSGRLPSDLVGGLRAKSRTTQPLGPR